LEDRFQRDENARKLLETIRDAFEFSNEADVLRKIQPGSAQAKVLDEMLECTTTCANVIAQSVFMAHAQAGTSA
jgi:hypothetical protein